jgi:hypothetical protein
MTSTRVSAAGAAPRAPLAPDGSALRGESARHIAGRAEYITPSGRWNPHRPLMQ